jgi:GNAT superfamily N-acetyltransferase
MDPKRSTLLIALLDSNCDNLCDTIKTLQKVPFDCGYPVPAFFIAKLAIDTRFQGAGAGSWLLRQALEKALSVSVEVGLYAVIVDAIDETAKGFYLKYGFESFAEHPLTLFLPLATIARALAGE